MAESVIIDQLGVKLPASGKFEFIASGKATVLLKAADGEVVTVSEDIYRTLIAKGFASKPGKPEALGFMPDEHCRLIQAMRIHVLREDKKHRRDGKSATESVEQIRQDLREHEIYAQYFPAKFPVRTLQIWKKKYSSEGKASLYPRTHERGNRGPRYDAHFEEIAWEVLEEQFLKNDRMSVGKVAPLVSKRYLDFCDRNGIKTEDRLDHGKRCLQAVLATLRVDDVVKARHDSETSKKLLLQAQFYHRVQKPFDLVEIDCTVADIFIAGIDGACAGRPTISAAIDAATGWPLAIRITLEAPSEALTVRTLKGIMTERGEAYFDHHGIHNRTEVVGVPQIVSVDQGSENSGPHLSAIVANLGIEWASNIPGCPEKKPHIERFMRELNAFLQTLPGSTNTNELPNRQRIEKGMLEAVLTLQDLEAAVAKWTYDVYAMKLRRLIHSPLRQAESPTASWNRLKTGILPMEPEAIHEVFMVQKANKKLHRYGIEIQGVQYFSEGLGGLISEIGAGATVDVRYDPTDIREIVVVHPRRAKPLVVTAKSEDIAAVSYNDVKRAKQPGDEAKAVDRGARATAAELAHSAQKLAEERGRGKVTSLKSAKAKERVRQKHLEIFNRSKIPLGKSVSDVVLANQPTPKLPVRRPVIEPME